MSSDIVRLLPDNGIHNRGFHFFGAVVAQPLEELLPFFLVEFYNRVWSTYLLLRL